jgi:hypothetical protein
MDKKDKTFNWIALTINVCLIIVLICVMINFALGRF